MINKIIDWSLQNRLLVILLTVLLICWGIYIVKQTAVDAIPDLSDVQVIVKVNFPGRAPTVIEAQITFPLTTTMMAVPGAKVVRGYSFYGDAYIYVLFADDTDLYWARARVLEYLNQALSKLPADAKVELGPDATGVGWVYEYALVDRSGQHDIAQLRSLQDWFLKYELRTVPGVAEVATVGGMVKTYQVIVDPNKLRAYQIPLSTVIDAIKKANQETGGSVLEMGEAEYMVRATGYLKSLKDIEQIPLSVSKTGTPIFLKDLATIQLGPQMRRGIAELNGQGEAVGGIIVMRYGQNPMATIAAVKTRLAELQQGLPQGVEVVPVYDRSLVIHRAITNLSHKLVEESLVVALVCLLFLMHLRSALVAIIALPIGILCAFIFMHYQGLNANIMSLGGIAIAIGAMIDAAIVMIENAHKKLEAWHVAHPQLLISTTEHFKLIAQAAKEVGPALFFCLLIITLSFAPVFTLQAQEGKLFAPLAFTKTYAMAAAAMLSITLIPVLMHLFIRGNIPSEQQNPINRRLIQWYLPLIEWVLRYPKKIILLVLIFIVISFYPLTQLGSEFMPPLQEGDLLYMPTAMPGLSVGKAAQLLQQTDKLIATVPEVKTVFGKAGRAETATDPAPIEMFETTIQLKPKNEWRRGMTLEKITNELDKTVQIPGLVNVWVQPIRNRIDMLATGMKSPVGIKIGGSDLTTIEKIGQQLESLLKNISGVTSVYAERLNGGHYINININRETAARFGLNIADIQAVIASSVGGENISETIEGTERYPINVRFPQSARDSLQKLRDLVLISPTGAIIPLSRVADLTIADGPPMIRSENARLSGWVYVDIRDRDLGSVVREAKKLVQTKLILPAGYSLTWSGQYEFMERASARMKIVIPFTLGIIFILLYFIFCDIAEVILIMATLPCALIGGLWYVYILGFNLSVATAVGFIALAGVATEFGVVMLVYVKQAIANLAVQNPLNEVQLKKAIIEGAVMRVRPKAMTMAVIIAGLIPIMLSHGTGSEVMQRIAAPMIGGMITAPLLSLFVIPAIYFLWLKSKK
jgi:Cu(I)/Ag(I) efflux system membrane protein CusA/SilA